MTISMERSSLPGSSKTDAMQSGTAELFSLSRCENIPHRDDAAVLFRKIFHARLEPGGFRVDPWMREIGDSVENKHSVCGIPGALHGLEKFISGAVMDRNSHDAEGVVLLRIECCIAAASGCHLSPFFQKPDHVFRNGTARIGECPGKRNGMFPALIFYVSEF